MIGWLLNLTTSTIQEKRQNRINRLHRQEQVYSQLTGLRIILDQLYLSVNDAFSLFDWIRARERLELPSRSDLGKIEEIHREYNELILELARNNQRLWETIGLVRLLFSPSEELEKLIEQLEPSIIKLREYRELISDYYESTTAECVNNPPNAALGGIEEEIHKHVDIPLGDLQKYLEDEMKATKRRSRQTPVAILEIKKVCALSEQAKSYLHLYFQSEAMTKCRSS
jgi:hypothetical protein